jgi:hypothetical protein
MTLKPQTSNLEPQTSNLKPQTSNLKPQTSNLEQQTCRPPRITYNSSYTDIEVPEGIVQAGFEVRAGLSLADD